MLLDRSKAPEFVIPGDFDISNPTEFHTSNGIKVFLFSTPLLEAVKIEVICKSSKLHLPLSKFQVPSFTLQLLTEGTQRFSEEELSEFFDFHASEVHPFSGFSQEGINLLTTKKHLNSVLPVFLSLFIEAIFPEEKIQKKKALRKIGLKMEREKNASRASMLFRNCLFGSQHPYGQETLESHLDEVNREDLLDYYQTKLWNKAEIFVSGDFNSEEILKLMEELSAIPKVDLESKIAEYSIEGIESCQEEKPDSVQTSIRLGNWSIPKNHPDYIPLTVFNTVLGGYFGSRLIKNIREDKGHTYGIFSSLGEIDDHNYWVISADVQKQFRQEVLEEIDKEIRLLCEVPLDEDELELVRNYLIGQMLGKFSNAFDLVDRFKAVHFSGEDFSFYQRQLEFFRKFNSSDILEIGKKYFSKEKFIEVLVG
ncbi:putative Zn-dependent peptidase [Algoriphagus boseongensis]|uniref:Putative Zn-dependent peptidase n=1 Tax=Algoriphagus boseongensis TaxID=1442587 RepID=A0A4R6T404_9BACT|nr:putative Zn-dependent peptidase [Algoriphagus boseongensis]